MIGRFEWALIAALAFVSCALLVRVAADFEPFPSGSLIPSGSTVERRAETGAALFGIDVSRWNRVAVARRQRTLRLAFEAGLVEAAWQLRQPSSYVVAFAGPNQQRCTVETDLGGALVAFQHIQPARDSETFQGSPAQAVQASRIATEAYAALWRRYPGTGEDFGFRLTADTVPEKDGYLFEWSSQSDPSGRLAWKLSYLIRDGEIVRFQVLPLPSDLLRETERDLQRTFEVFLVAILLAGILALLYAVAVVIVNLYRERLPWAFVLRVMGFLGFLVILDYSAGERAASFWMNWQESAADAVGSVVVALIGYALAVCAICAGRATRIAADFGRWLGLEDFLRLQWNKASVTRSLLAAFLVAPVWLGISYGILAVTEGGFAESLSLFANVLRMPPLLGVYAGRGLAILTAVGFAIPLVRASAGNRRIQIALAVLVSAMGSVLAANIEFPIPLMLLEALLHGALLVYAYRRFGLLAALLGGVLSEPLGRAFVFFQRGELAPQAWGLLMLAGSALFFCVVLFLDLRNPNREEEQRLSQEEFEALKRESERRLVTRRERLLGEFKLAQQAQQRMLPDHPPAVAGFEISSICAPAQQVGGDLYDYIQISDSRLALCVADVSGKGVSAALYMTMVKGLLGAVAMERADLLGMVTVLNEHIHRTMEKRSFVTMMIAALDPFSRKLEVLRAGHPPMLYVRADGQSQFLSSNGMGLGLVSSSVFRRRLNTATVRMAPGDVAVLYSDGVSEAMNRQREEFGEERLAQVVEGAVGEPADAIRQRILDAIVTFQAGATAHDDITVMVLKALRGTAPSAPES